MKRAKISVVINTYNADLYLESVLQSVNEFDEILVCDMESTDNTRSIAQAYGCRIINFPKGDLHIVEPAREFAIHEATNEWVLVVDADEVISPELKTYLYDTIQAEQPPCGLNIPRKNQLMGRFMHGYYPDYNLRFFRKSITSWPATIHSQPQVNGRIEKIPRNRWELAIEHKDDRSISQRLAKINLYTEYETEKRRNRNYSALAFFYRPMARFLKCYILKGGFRDGIPGLLFAWLEAVQQFTILAKLYEEKQKDNS